MLKINYNIILGCLIIAIGIVLHGYITKPNVNDLKSSNNNQISSNIENKSVFNITELAEYLNMTQKQVKGIIRAESERLSKNGTFTGTRLPYFTVDDKLYFYKKGIDRWLEDVIVDKREYNTNYYEMSR